MAKTLTKKVLPGQSIWDFAVQHLGSPVGVSQLMDLNPSLNFEDSLVPGSDVIIGEVLDQKVVDFFDTQILKPATAWEEPKFSGGFSNGFSNGFNI